MLKNKVNSLSIIISLMCTFCFLENSANSADQAQPQDTLNANEIKRDPVSIAAFTRMGKNIPSLQNSLPKILNSDDIVLYRKIFKLQEAGDWSKANILITKLQDKILIGHVEAQKYLHPTAYRSKYSELKNWMELYADHPDATRIYRLALKRRPANWKYPD